MIGTERRLTAEQLATALRSGLERRWPLPSAQSGEPGPFPPGGNVRAFLSPYADTLNYRLPYRRKFLYRVVRWARYLVRAVITPWLRVQSHFNSATINVIEQLEQRIRTLEDTERSLRQKLEACERVLREKS